MTIHLNADAPSVNRVATRHTLKYVTLTEYCRLALREHEAVMHRLKKSDFSFGDGWGDHFIDEPSIRGIVGHHPERQGMVLPLGVLIFIG